MFRIVMLLVGSLALAMGLLWISQGMGLVRWPASSFMIDMSAWIWRGAVLAAAGLAMLLLARRMR